MTTQETTYGIGDLARNAGLTVRTLRWWDQIGLLRPSERSAAGRRGYDAADVRRLYRICLLRRAGLALEEIGQALDDPGWDLGHALRRHLELLDERLAAAALLRRRLADMLASLGRDVPPTSDDLFEAMEEMGAMDGSVQRRISILVYEDIPAIQAHLVDVLGLGPGRLDHDDEGRCVHGEVDAGDGVIWLHRVAPEFGLASPRTLGAATGTTAVIVADVDAHHTRAADRGADVLYPPVDQPYGYREWSARDPEGGLWSFMAPLG